jgi:hypothetical protein
MGQNPRVGGVNNPEDVIYGDFNYTQKMEPKNLSDWKRKIRNPQLFWESQNQSIGSYS